METTSGARARVLVVEDDEALRWLAAEILSHAGYEVLQAGGLHGAVAAAAEGEVDVLVLDRNLPDGDGLHLLDHPSLAHARVLVLTVRSEEEDFKRAFERGAHHYLVKPFDPSELLRSLERVLVASPDELDAKRRREVERARLLVAVERLFEDAKLLQGTALDDRVPRALGVEH